MSGHDHAMGSEGEAVCAAEERSSVETESKIAEGKPEEIINIKASYTGQFLKSMLK